MGLVPFRTKFRLWVRTGTPEQPGIGQGRVKWGMGVRGRIQPPCFRADGQMQQPGLWLVLLACLHSESADTAAGPTFRWTLQGLDSYPRRRVGVSFFLQH